MANTQTDKYGAPPDAGQGTQQGTPTHVNLPPIGVPWTVDANGNVIPYTATGVQTGTHTERQRGLDPGEQQRSVTSPILSDVPARYFSGDEYAPASQGPDWIAAYQTQLVQAGLLKPHSYQPSVWDPPTIAAYTQLLGAANASGLDKETMLSRWTAAAIANPGAGAGPLTVRLSNPQDLAAVFRKAVIDTLGEGWATDKIDQMVQAYQGLQASQQTQEHNLALGGGTVTGAPSPQAFAEQQARTQNPLQAQEHDVIAPGGPLDAFKSMLKGWS